jgi:hypothetical protein
MDAGRLSLTLCEDSVEEEEENLITGAYTHLKDRVGDLIIEAYTHHGDWVGELRTGVYVLYSTHILMTG